MSEYRDGDFELSRDELWRLGKGAGRSQVSAKAKNTHQKEFLRSMYEMPLSFGVGPAGVGKSFLAVAQGLQMLQRGSVSRLVLTRPAVEAGEKIGFLPGTAEEKLDPYLRPLFDVVRELTGSDVIDMEQIEVAPLSFMRGRTFKDAFVILDEAQNSTPAQMKMFLTRFGKGSKYVVTGDPEQSDLPGGKNGLSHALDVVEGVRGVHCTWFDTGDVVRHPLVGRLLDAYRAEKARAEEAENSPPNSDRGLPRINI